MLRRSLYKNMFALGVIVAFLFFSTVAAAQSITSVSPVSGTGGQTLDVRIKASDTNFEQDVSVAEFSGDGITVNSTEVRDATHAIANITIASGATIGSRDVNVVTGAETPTLLADGFAVAYPVPTITGITPSDETNDGFASIVDLAGTNFRDGAVVKFMKAGSDDIQAQNVTVFSSDRITCDVNLTNAKAGFWDVYVENDDGLNTTSQDLFRVTNAETPTLGIEILKTGPTEAEINEHVTFNVAVRNIGTDDLISVVVADPMFGDEWFRNLGAIEPGEIKRFTQGYTITIADSNPLVNTASAVGRANSGGERAIDQNGHSVEIASEPISLSKDAPDKAEFGNTVTYYFTVWNGGSENLTNVTVTDPLFGNDWSYEIGSLGVGESRYFEEQFDFIDTDPNEITNTATVTGTDEFGFEVTDSDSHTVELGSFGNCSLVLNSSRTELRYSGCGATFLLVSITILFFLRSRPTSKRSSNRSLTTNLN
jgi:uncharacterized repeat protein (TIGR01451 family)